MSKVNRIPWLVAAAALLLVTLGVGTSGPAAARGFCNIDRLGKDELQKEVTNAGAVFFDGGSYLMQMLAAFERGDGDKGKTVGSFAASSFKSASEQYNNIASANKISEIGDNKLAAVKPEDAATIAQASSATPVFKEIAEAAGGQKAPSNLMKICGKQSERMRTATDKFLRTKQDQEKDFVALLSEWIRALVAGRVISVFFDIAGSQN